MLHSSGVVSQLILLRQCRPYDVKCIELDSHSSIYTMFILAIINAMMIFKKIGRLFLICIETN